MSGNQDRSDKQRLQTTSGTLIGTDESNANPSRNNALAIRPQTIIVKFASLNVKLELIRGLF